jgi:ribosomal protein S18 acetylase RimI-like enzyme
VLAESVLNPAEDGHLRPFRIESDLSALADLIEVAFEDELQRTGNRIVTEMRRLAKGGPLLRLFGGGGLLPDLTDGYVWIQGGKLVGSVSLMPHGRVRGVLSITNVAVFPDYRRQGIARRLVVAAMQRAADRGAHRLVLELEADNEAARQLYDSLGYTLYDTVHALRMPRVRWPKCVSPPGLPLRPCRPDDASALQVLARASIPEQTQGATPIDLAQPLARADGWFSAWLLRLLRRSVRSAWVLDHNATLVALLQITERAGRGAHWLRMMVHPTHPGTIERDLLDKAFHELGHSRRDLRASVSEAHPQALRAFHDAGFETVRALAQMTVDLHPASDGEV